MIQVSPADLPEGKYPQSRIRTLIETALDSLDKLPLDREDRRGNNRAVYLSLCSKNFFSCHMIRDDILEAAASTKYAVYEFTKKVIM